jgi:hypothetical protein
VFAFFEDDIFAVHVTDYTQIIISLHFRVISSTFYFYSSDLEKEFQLFPQCLQDSFNGAIK